MSYPLIFDPEVAANIGLGEAIILHQIGYWVKKKRENNQDFHDGYFWTYNSIAAWEKQFPFWSHNTIQRYLNSLQSQKMIFTGEYNRSPFDKTRWYTLTSAGEALLSQPNKSNHPELGNGKPIIGVNDDTRPGESDDTNSGESTMPVLANQYLRLLPETSTKTSKKLYAQLDTFWKAYPKKKSKGQAEKAFRKIKPDEQLLATMLATIERAKKSADWQKENGKYIPYPATWLNARGWEDEISEETRNEEEREPHQWL